MIETWLPILGLLLFGIFIWWITTGTGFWARFTWDRGPPGPGLKAAWWIAYAATVIFVLSNSSCEGPGELGRHQERQPREYAAPMEAEWAGTFGRHRQGHADV
jgi:hypothetical protein